MGHDFIKAFASGAECTRWESNQRSGSTDVRFGVLQRWIIVSIVSLNRVGLVNRIDFVGHCFFLTNSESLSDTPRQ